VNHPDQAEWMAFLYNELPSNAKRELQSHLQECSPCAANVQTWRSSMNALDAWKLPVRRRKAIEAVPIFKWAAAAAAVLVIGFFLGRQTSSSSAEITRLKTSVARLTDFVEAQSATTISNSIAASAAVANAETVRLLTDYSRLQEEQRAADRQDMNLALRTLDLRLNRIHNDVKTLAVRAETGFEEAHENITRVASLSLAAKN